MTPMVDLAFLLLTFFVLAASLAKPKSLELIYPSEGKNTPVNERMVTTILLGDSAHKVFYYRGMFDVDSTQLIPTDFSSHGLRHVLFALNETGLHRLNQLHDKLIAQQISQDEYDAGYKNLVNDDDAPMVVIKTMKGTKYEYVISTIDELNITGIRKRIVQKMSEEEAVRTERERK